MRVLQIFVLIVFVYNVGSVTIYDPPRAVCLSQCVARRRGGCYKSIAADHAVETFPNEH